MKNLDRVYGELQKHPDTMPVGYPATQSGVELRLLKFLFTPEKARIALGLDHRFRTAEPIYHRIKDSGISLEELKTILRELPWKAVSKMLQTGYRPGPVEFYDTVMQTRH